MIGRRAANTVACGRPPRIFLRQLEAIPILYSAPTRPGRRRRMRFVPTPPTVLPRQHACEPAPIHNPASGQGSFLSRLLQLDSLGSALLESDPERFGGTQESSPSLGRASQDFFVQGPAIDLP